MHFICCIIDLGLIATYDFAKSATFPFHETKPVKNISKNRVSPRGRNRKRVSFLNYRTIGHTAGRINLHPIIENVNVDFTTIDQVITVLCEVNSYAKKVLVLS